MACSTGAPHAQTAIPGLRAGSGWRIPAPRSAEPAGTLSPPDDRAADRLTDRDRELVRHLVAGRSTAQIAAAMSVSSNTVRTRIRRVSGKLVVAGRYEIVAAARVLGLA